VSQPAAVAVAVALSLAAAGGTDLDGRGPTAAPRSRDPELVPRECELAPDFSVTVECSWLLVPMDRDKPRGETIRLAVAVLKSSAAQPAPDPVVYLEGGPGGFVVEDLESFADEPFLESRDLILFDQRGTGLSEPDLECPEREEAVVRNLGRDEPYRERLADFRDATKQCRTRITDAGIDLDVFDTEASAADLADLRVALGVDGWNLWGISYGTRLALATMRSHPEGIRSAILDSVYPPTVGGLGHVDAKADRAFQALFDGCAADPACDEAYPDLEDTFRGIVDAFNETPFEGTVDLDEPFGTVPLVVTGDDITAGLFNALYDTELISVLPMIGAGLAQGDTAIIPAIAQRGIPFANSFAEAMQFSVDCADSGARLGADDLDLLDESGDKGGLFVYFSDAYCRLWDVEPLPAAFNKPVRSRIPSLVMAGTYDPATPPADSRATVKALRNATYVEFEGSGHGVSFENDCATAIILAFVDDPGAPVDITCAEDVEPTFTV